MVPLYGGDPSVARQAIEELKRQFAERQGDVDETKLAAVIRRDSEPESFSIAAADVTAGRGWPHFANAYSRVATNLGE
jgi:hypothetical protein